MCFDVFVLIVFFPPRLTRARRRVAGVATFSFVLATIWWAWFFVPDEPPAGDGELAWGMYVHSHRARGFSRETLQNPETARCESCLVDGAHSEESRPTIYLLRPLQGGRGGKKNKKSWKARGRKDTRQRTRTRTRPQGARSVADRRIRNLKSSLRWKAQQRAKGLEEAKKKADWEKANPEAAQAKRDALKQKRRGVLATTMAKLGEQGRQGRKKGTPNLRFDERGVFRVLAKIPAPKHKDHTRKYEARALRVWVGSEGLGWVTVGGWVAV